MEAMGSASRTIFNYNRAITHLERRKIVQIYEFALK